MDLESNFTLNTEFAKNSRFIIDIHTKIENINRWKFLSDLYDKWLDSKKNNRKEKPKIPKIIHHIWLGSPLPKKYLEFINTWKTKNPEWEFILWDEKKLEDLDMINKNLYLKLKNYGAKSDVARLEILYKMGGIYLDTDFECFKKIDEDLLINDFIAGTVFNSFPELANGFLAAKPFSKIIYKCLEDLKKIKKNNLISHEIIEETGPFFLTRTFFNYCEEKNIYNEKILILPTNYFYPLPSYLKFCSLEEVYKYQTNKSIAIHHWESSWNNLTLLDRLKAKFKKIFFPKNYI